MAGLSLKSKFRAKPGISESDNFLRHRLSSHRLDRTAFKRPDEAVAWYGAMQGQDYRHARWAVGIRCAGVTEADVERAIADRNIIRTWAMRGSLQLVAADDAIWLLNLVGPRMLERVAVTDARQFDLDDAAFAAAEKALARILGGKVLTRKETYAALERQGVSTTGQRGYHVMDRWDVPENTNAVFETTLATIGDTFGYIYNTWLTGSGYRHAAAPYFERYGENFSPENPALTIYIPIEPAS